MVVLSGVEVMAKTKKKRKPHKPVLRRIEFFLGSGTPCLKLWFGKRFLYGKLHAYPISDEVPSIGFQIIITKEGNDPSKAGLVSAAATSRLASSAYCLSALKSVVTSLVRSEDTVIIASGPMEGFPQYKILGVSVPSHVKVGVQNV